MVYTEHYHNALLQGGTFTDLHVNSASVTMDEGWTPHVQAEIVIPLPDETLNNALDPRVTPRITLFLRASATAGDSTYQFFDLTVRRREADLDAGTTALGLASDEAILMDTYHVSDTPNSAGNTYASSLRDLIDNVILGPLGWALDPGTADHTFNPADPDVDDDMLVWFPGESAWDYVQPLLQVAGLRLFCDNRRRWRLIEGISYIAAGNTQLAYALSLGQAVDTVDRDSDDWYDSAVVIYEHEGTRAYDHYTAPGGPIKTRTFTIDRPFPGPGFAEYAVKRSLGRGRALQLAAVSNYSVLPSQAVTAAAVPTVGTVMDVVRSVTWQISDSDDDCTMQIVTRGVSEVPAASWFSLAAGEAWEDSPIDESWIDEVV